MAGVVQPRRSRVPRILAWQLSSQAEGAAWVPTWWWGTATPRPVGHSTAAIPCPQPPWPPGSAQPPSSASTKGQHIFWKQLLLAARTMFTVITAQCGRERPRCEGLLWDLCLNNTDPSLARPLCLLNPLLGFGGTGISSVCVYMCKRFFLLKTKQRNETAQPHSLPYVHFRLYDKKGRALLLEWRCLFITQQSNYFPVSR